MRTRLSVWSRLLAALSPIASSGQLLEPGMIRREHRARNQDAIRSLCANAYLGQDDAVARVLGRYKLIVDTRDTGLSAHLLLDGFWEMWTTEALVEAVKPSMICVDAGANLGYFTVLMAELVGPGGRVHAFEPNPALVERLCRSVSINPNGERVVVHGVALGRVSDDTMNLIVPHGEPKNGHLVPAEGAPADTLAVTCHRLDDFPQLLDVDLIKIDVETSEEAVWDGMAGLLARNRPLTVLLEFTSGRYLDPAAFLDRILRDGFTLARLDLREGIQRVSRADILLAPSSIDQMLVLTR